MPSTQDLQAPFDPTGYTSITGAQLLQYINGTYPGTDTGLVISTTDDNSGNADIPDATTDTKWQKYIWRRIGSVVITLYVWNPAGATDVYGTGFQKWQPAFSAAIGAGTIQGYQIANNTVTDINISDVNWSKISGTPSTLNNGAAAGGDLAGTFPDPVVAPLAITTSKIAVNAIKGGASNQLATGANGATLGDNIAPTANSNLGSPSGGSTAIAANDRVVINAAKTGYSTVQKAIDALAEPTAQSFMDVQVNAAGTGFQYSAHRILQQVLIPITDKLASSGSLSTSGTPVYNATGNTAVKTLTSAFTPLSASSTIVLELDLQVYYTNVAGYIYVGLYTAQSTAAPVAFNGVYNNCPLTRFVTAKANLASPGTSAMNLYVTFGVSTSTGYVNSIDGSATIFGGLQSYLKITEYL